MVEKAIALCRGSEDLSLDEETLESVIFQAALNLAGNSTRKNWGADDMWRKKHVVGHISQCDDVYPM